MISTHKLMDTVQLFSNTVSDEIAIEAINEVPESVLGDQVLKATVTVTRLMSDGTVTHQEINVDNESDMMTNHGFIGTGELENTSEVYRLLTAATSTYTTTTANEAHIGIGGRDTVTLIPQRAE